MLKYKFTKQEKKDIELAYNKLSEIFTTRISGEFTLQEALKYERKDRGTLIAKALIVRSVHSRNEIKRRYLYGYSQGLLNCVIAAYSVFYNPKGRTKKNINEFKILAHNAGISYNACIIRGIDALCN